MQKTPIAPDVDTYIAGYPKETQKLLNSVRSAIKNAAPDAVESIAYAIPAYKYKGKPIAYFGGYAQHIGFYATPHAHEGFAERLAPYKQGRGSVQFPSNQPMPLTLISDMVRFNYEQLQ